MVDGSLGTSAKILSWVAAGSDVFHSFWMDGMGGKDSSGCHPITCHFIHLFLNKAENSEKDMSDKKCQLEDMCTENQGYQTCLLV